MVEIFSKKIFKLILCKLCVVVPFLVMICLKKEMVK